jgi:hypothetical protein
VLRLRRLNCFRSGILYRHAYSLNIFRLLLLTVHGPTSFEDLRTVGGVEYDTFREAAVAHDLFTSDDLLERTVKEALDTKMSKSASIRYFAMILVHCEPSDPAALLEKFVDDIWPPGVLQPGDAVPRSHEKEYRKLAIMKRLEYYLREQGTSCKYVHIEI